MSKNSVQVDYILGKYYAPPTKSGEMLDKIGYVAVCFFGAWIFLVGGALATVGTYRLFTEFLTDLGMI